MLAAYRPYDIERSEWPVLGVDASSRQITLDTCVYCSGGGGGVLHLLGAVSHSAPHLHLPTVLSCPVLFFSRPRSGHTCTYFLHLSLSSVHSD